jgi:hypothetical protein
VKRRAAAIALCACASALAAAPTALAQGGDCLTADPPPAEPGPIDFGVTPGIAGSAGVGQGTVRPVNRKAELRALERLEPKGGNLVLRLNRLFWDGGGKLIRKFAKRVDRYARAGFESEIQVRYHPPEGKEGNLRAWARFVGKAVRRLGRRPSVTAFSITNEINFPVSPNTSDGSYDRALEAMARGVVVAHRQLRRLGRPDVDLGFSVAWRYTPQADAALWDDLGQIASPRFRRALDYVGVQVYPGLIWPPVEIPGRTAGDEIAEALTLIRDCYMPKAALGDEVDLWVSENGYPTKPAVNTEAGQAERLVSSVEAVAAHANDLGITDYRWFNLRDNDSDGADLFSQVGLLRDDYSEKPSFAEYRAAIRRLGR